MTIRVERVKNRATYIPAFAFIPERPCAYTVVVHGYGGCKEEQFPLAGRTATIVYAERDVPEIMRDCENLKRRGAFVERINNTSQADIFLAQETFEIITVRIDSCLNSQELRKNSCEALTMGHSI